MIPREGYMRKIRPFMGTEVVKVITGIRRCGKSVMLGLIRDELLAGGVPPERLLFFNCESAVDERVRGVDGILSAIKALALSGGDQVHLFFDEIQELAGWERLINSLLVDFPADIYITGSSARLLSGELATYLAGRYVEIRMYPFSFAEICALSKTRDPGFDKAKLFSEYLVRGGFPFLYRYPLDEDGVRQYLSGIFDSVILKDIIQRNKVRDVELLHRLILFFLANTGRTFSSSSLSRYLKNQRRSVSTETIYNYIDHCRSACLLHLAPREDLLGKEILATQEKVYLADHGLRETVYGNNLRDIDQILENIVYMELLSRGYEVTIGRVKDAEIDFCARMGGKRFYVQVAYLLSGPETLRREFGALERIPDNFAKYVLSMDEIDLSRQGIIHMNIRDFLLIENFE
ncbi:MAG: ATPase [Treponema sp. GWB1_62_6]|nr:MAG: ATPase [Treponema sp. GWB1_62_6]OHE69004.1 MAG: ATPase [Treponema sp. GWC1_61_84]OHE69964.1 MAG: ATPase [Treponema sp. RIFOXYC1_FULL_61_9]HCM28503.1 ATPase [Treponema sp.]